MLADLWFTYLYQPLFNALIWIYANIADQNLGWAVIWLTIFLRVILLPFTIISERNAIREAKVEAEVAKIAEAYKHDRVAQKAEIRKLMKKNHVSPWAKVFSLGVQFLVLILLYQVFVRGITGEKVVKILYPMIDFPGAININFYGFNIGKVHDLVWPTITALYLFISIIIENKSDKGWNRSKASFAIIFPLFTFFALWLLPMVKALFILTSMIFSDIIKLFRMVFFPVKP
ncbi:MAG TPA: YidC/Oxa1 family membrane protein insertase [Patescibacteria group bacterium]|nr:YidC/Oxa1 family membrane protein insertase [Patescibacteria group bacterium]